jgi:hypothetical protein
MRTMSAENIQNATVDGLIAVAAQNIDAAEKIMIEYQNYDGPYAQFSARIGYADLLFNSAQTYIALAEYKRRGR